MVQIHVPPPIKADLAQPAEHIHGKDGVFGSNPKIGSRKLKTSLKFFINKKNIRGQPLGRRLFCCLNSKQFFHVLFAR